MLPGELVRAGASRSDPFAAEKLIGQGAQIKATLLSEDFDLETYLEANDKNVIPLFGIDTRERLRAFTDKLSP